MKPSESNNGETTCAEANLEDLPINQEQGEETKGAGLGAPNGKIYVATNTGVFVN